ncbi:MAG: primosomal protein N', partial [Gammaproteobacteria bacterium]|nr:primosomal protein N' [Gammaproteobacteria bacterium]
MSRETASIVRVAVPVPLRKGFDFTTPTPPPAPGTRVLVPFRQRRLVGIVLELTDASQLPANRVKSIIRVLDGDPVFTPALFDTLRWAAAYYHHPLGEVLLAALPPRLRVDHAQSPKPNLHFRLSALGCKGDLDDLRRAPLQRVIVEQLRRNADRAYAAHQLAQISRSWKAAVAALEEKGWIDAVPAYAGSYTPGRVRAPQLNRRQRAAADAIIASLGSYRCFLLHGVTGSGKTEVYLQVVAKCLARGQQALVMVPEIALTPQLVGRFRDRFGEPVAVLHSGLAALERHRVWWFARRGEIRVVLGTRSAVFTPFRDLGVIVVDEEHDPSYKQQEGFRYHARDLAIYRGRVERVPVVLGSATPALESLANVQQNRFALLELPERVGEAQLP